MSRTSLVRAGAWTLALLYACWLLGWSLRPDHFFFADDWDWIYRAQSLKLIDQFTLLPRHVYYDRPVGALLISVLYGFFGLNPAPYHWVLLGLHLANMTLVLALARRWLSSWWVAAAAALAWGTWSAALAAATLLSAIFDVLGNTLVLASILAFHSRRTSTRLLSAALYFLAVRTKGVAIGLPALLLVYVLLTHPRRAWLRETFRTLWPHILVALVLVALYIPMLAAHQNSGDPDKTYRMEFTLRTSVDGLYYYVSSMLYGRPWPVGRLIRWMVVAAAGVAVIALRVRPALAAMAGFVVFLAPVLFLARHRDVLYLYIPAVFFALALGGAAEAVAGRVRVSAAWRERTAAAMMLLSMVALPHVVYMRKHGAWMLETTAQAKRHLEAFRTNCASLKPGARVALLGFPAGYNLFSTQGCSALKVAYGVDAVSCEFTADGSGADVVVVYREDGLDIKCGAVGH